MKNFGNNYAELAHHWVYERDSSYCYENRMFSNGNSMYSYGSHYMIAQFVTHKGEEVVLFNSNGSSHTTEKQKNVVRSAVSHLTVFTVPEAGLNHGKNVAYYLESIEGLINKANRARTKTQDYFEEAEEIRIEFLKYIEFFGIKLSKKEKEIAENSITNTTAVDIQSAWKAKERREKAQRRLERKKEYEKEQKKLSQWLNGELDHLYTHYHDTAFLRVKDEYVETSQGASVPVREAKVLWGRISSGKDVKGFKIGNYTVIGMNGELKIGCHSIDKKEIERFTKKYGWA